MSVPYVIEEHGNGERTYDLYSRLLKDRIIFIGRSFRDELANSVTAQLLFLESDDSEKDITIYINSPGGNVHACLAIYDTMNYIKPDIRTVCIGEACSAAAFILAAGTKVKRSALKNARIMLHQVSSGADGNIADIKILLKEADVRNEILLGELSKITGHSIKKLKKDLDRDYFMSPEEAKEYGIIDEILFKREK